MLCFKSYFPAFSFLKFIKNFKTNKKFKKNISAFVFLKFIIFMKETSTLNLIFVLKIFFI